MIVTASEMIETLVIAKDFPPQDFNSSTIQKAEDLIANQFLGEDFYESILASKTSAGVFSNVHYQAFYDRCLRTLLSESVLLSVCIKLALKLDNIGIVQLNANNASALNLEMITAYKTEMSQAVSDSKLICNSYLTNIVRSANFSLYLKNATTSQASQPTVRKNYAGFPLNF